MLKLQWIGTGKIVVGLNAKVLVKCMRNDSPWLPNEQQNSDQAYMAGVARRTEVYTGVAITYTNPVEFLQGLQDLGLIHLEEVM